MHSIMLRTSIRSGGLGRVGNPALALRARSSAQARHITLSSYLVTPKELNEALKDNSKQEAKIVPLCASWFLPNDREKRTGLQVFKEERIQGARFFDIDQIKDHNSPYPHMLPSAEDFAKAMGELGVRNQDTVVVYDSKEVGIFSAPRAGWTLKVFGHEKVHILNNFKIWVEEGYPTETGEPAKVQAVKYEVPKVDRPKKTVDFDFVKKLAKGEEVSEDKFSQAAILDARPRGRWAGTSPEPRPGMPSGHIPGSLSMPFAEVLDSRTRAILPKDQLRETFRSFGVNETQPVIASCGTGVSAAIIDAALEEAGFVKDSDRYIYDGSWTEWAQRVKDEEDLIRQSYD